MEELEKLLATLCPQCAASVRAVVDTAQGAVALVKAATAKEAEVRHAMNEAAAKQRVEATLGEAEAVLKGKR